MFISLGGKVMNIIKRILKTFVLITILLSVTLTIAAIAYLISNTLSFIFPKVISSFIFTGDVIFLNMLALASLHGHDKKKEID